MDDGSESGARSERSEWVSRALDDHERALLAYARRLLSDPERARDVVQETFLRLCRAKRSDVEGHLRRWLFAVCRNKALDELRRRRHVATPTALEHADARPGPAAMPVEIAALRDDVRAALTALDGLPDREREVLHLRFRESMSYRQISAVTELSVSHVGVLIHTAMKRLRRELRPATGSPACTGGATA